MAYMSMYKGIVFIEGREPSATILGDVEYKKLFSFNSQIQTLNDVKDQLVEQVIALGGNAVVDFIYGQKSSGWFTSSLFGLDDNIKWYGRGKAASVPANILESVAQR